MVLLSAVFHAGIVTQAPQELHEHYIRSLDLNALAMEWKDFYNKKRPHSSLGGVRSWQKLQSTEHLISDRYDYAESLWDSEEKIMYRNYEYIKLLKKKNISPYNRKPVTKKSK
jgi:hypothetical protein